MNSELKIPFGINNLESMLGFFCDDKNIVFTKEGSHIENEEAFSSDKFLPALAFHSFNIFRSPLGSLANPNEKGLVEAMMPVYVDSKENKDLDCQVVFENKAFALMVISDYIEKINNYILSSGNRLNATVEIEIGPMIDSFKEALEKNFVQKLSLVEANKKGFRLS